MSTLAAPPATAPALRRSQRAWCMYDWANSVYSLVITTTVFPIYYQGIADGIGVGDTVNFLGAQLPAGALLSYTLSAAFLTVALLNPALSGLADATGRRMAYMKRFCYLGAASCIALYGFTPERFELGIAAFYLATVGFCGSQVFYNAYLPSLAAEADRDRLSARGFSYGYVGSIILQVMVLVPILKPDWFGGISAALASRLAFVAVGLWWAGFAQITFRGLPQDRPTPTGLARALRFGWMTLFATYRRVRAQPVLWGFLVAYFFYNTGVQTIMYLATLFASHELHIPQGGLISAILLLQVVAIPGAMATAWASGRFGNLAVLTGLVIVWMGVCVGAYLTHTAEQFYLLAAVVGMVMGGIQSLSRSTWARMLPAQERNTASYFSFQDFTEKLSIVVGTLAYGLIEHLTGSMRLSSLALVVFFALGLIGLLRVARLKGEV